MILTFYSVAGFRNLIYASGTKMYPATSAFVGYPSCLHLSWFICNHSGTETGLPEVVRTFATCKRSVIVVGL